MSWPTSSADTLAVSCSILAVLGLCCPAASGIEVPVVALLLFVYSTSAMLVTPSYDDINIYFI